jgi:hypothetical protein
MDGGCEAGQRFREEQSPGEVRLAYEVDPRRSMFAAEPQ